MQYSIIRKDLVNEEGLKSLIKKGEKSINLALSLGYIKKQDEDGSRIQKNRDTTVKKGHTERSSKRRG